MLSLGSQAGVWGARKNRESPGGVASWAGKGRGASREQGGRDHCWGQVHAQLSRVQAAVTLTRADVQVGGLVRRD